MIKGAINGLGRIGRAFLKMSIDNPELEIVAVNDLGDINNFAYLLKYDSAYKRQGLDIRVDGNNLIISGQTIKFLSEKNPSNLPWGDLKIDVVVESTGIFDSYEKARAHLEAGAKKVVISAPVKGEPIPGITGAIVLMGINDEKLSTCQISSNASCTTNSVAPIIQIMKETVGVKKAILNTIHAYTATQKIVDGPDTKDFRRGRAAAQNIVPSSTGAALAVGQVIPDLTDLFDGVAMRVPVVTGSVSDITFITNRPTTKEEINDILRQAGSESRWQNIFMATDELLVSSDIIGNTHASIADLGMTRVVDGDLVKILAWYDNEIGYTHTLVE